MNGGPKGVVNIGMWVCVDELVRVCMKSEIWDDGKERV